MPWCRSSGVAAGCDDDLGRPDPPLFGHNFKTILVLVDLRYSTVPDYATAAGEGAVVQPLMVTGGIQRGVAVDDQSAMVER